VQIDRTPEERSVLHSPVPPEDDLPTLALHPQRLDPDQGALPVPRHQPVLGPGAALGHTVDAHVVPLARLAHRVQQRLVLPLAVPVDRVQDLDLRPGRVRVVDELSKLLCASS